VDSSLYEQVGGEAFFVRLVDAFYVGVEGDEILRSMYPEDLTESKRHLVLFLMQYWEALRPTCKSADTPGYECVTLRFI